MKYLKAKSFPSFDLYLSPYLWTMVEANSTTKEVIHDTTSQSSLQICLVNTETGPEQACLS
uniref:Malectin-like domain-containing protein n=1 Tax=Brassica oleracea TaxID=3712 RepID=A0A3P6DD75_BRAOL|nr:unnamed protein product [Brassica oleracea]